AIGARRLEVKNLLIKWCSGTCVPRRACGAARQQSLVSTKHLLGVARRAGHMVRHAIESGSLRILLCQLRVAQDMWRGAPVENSKQMFITVICASRRTNGAARRNGILRKSMHFNWETVSLLHFP
ncbi:hypothetical protein A2U01_0039530, partial [Trifolium medium]|nr:hypothetical protein [Trifolium medium]